MKDEDIGSISRTINISKNPNKPEYVHLIATWNGKSRNYFMNGEKVTFEEYMCSITGVPPEMFKQRDGSQTKIVKI